MKIYGTSNAYTTLRPYDVVLYNLNDPIDGKKEALGLYLGGVNEELRLLCCGEMGGYKFHVDHNYEAMNAQALQNEGKIKRVITANRVRDQPESVTIEEWLSSDIFIPIGDGKADLMRPQTITDADRDIDREETPKLTLKNFDAFLRQQDVKLEQNMSVEEASKINRRKFKGERITLDVVEKEVLKLEEQITVVLDMISRLKVQEQE